MREISFAEAIKQIKKGKKVYYKNSDIYYQLNDEKIICKYDNCSLVTYNAGLYKNFEYFLDEPEVLTIKVNECYRTKSGKKVFIFSSGVVDENESIKVFKGVILGDENVYLFDIFGRLFKHKCFISLGFNENEYDLKTLWVNR